MTRADAAGRSVAAAAARWRSWRRYCLLLAVLFVTRGLFLLCFFPPLEGPDEYQHIANLVFVAENGTSPVFGRAQVPTSLYPDLVAQPHSVYDWAQTRAIGAVRYKNYPQSRPSVASLEPIPLYQAQHPPLYYRLFAPLFAGLRERFGFRPAVYGLRFLNLVFAGAGFALLLHPLGRMFGTGEAGRLAALVISLLPMALVSVCRVSNDALALLFAGLAVVTLEGVVDGRRRWLRCAVAGGLLGLGVWVKLTVFGFLPAALLWIALLAVSRNRSLRPSLAGGAALAAAYLVVAGPLHLHNLREFGTPFLAQETIRNTAAGLTWLDIAGNIRLGHVRSFFFERMTIGNLWTSGWSFLRPNAAWEALFRAYFALTLGGAVVGLVRRLRAGMRAVPPAQGRAASLMGGDRSAFAPSLLFGCIVAFSLLGAYAHGLHSQSAHGGIVTPAYYVMPGFPSLLALTFIALEGCGSRRCWYAVVAGLGVLFAAMECHSLFTIALPHWTNGHTVREMMQRTTLTHPVFPSPWAAPGVVLSVGALTVVALRLLTTGSRGDGNPIPHASGPDHTGKVGAP